MNIPQNFKLYAGLLKVSLFLPQVRIEADIEKWVGVIQSAVLDECEKASTTFKIHDDWQKMMVGISICDGSRENLNQILIQILGRMQSLNDVDVMDSSSDVVEF